MAETIEQQQALALATARLRLSQAPAPAEGNMYTQGAEDIQYSPEGIPLNTSSYGSANPYQKTTKALTTAVSVPLNIATGAAKLPAAVVQSYDKYIGGGDIGDNMVKPLTSFASAKRFKLFCSQNQQADCAAPSNVARYSEASSTEIPKLPAKNV